MHIQVNNISNMNRALYQTETVSQFYFFANESTSQQGDNHFTKTNCSYSVNAACLEELQQIPILMSLVLPSWRLNPSSSAIEEIILTLQHKGNVTPPNGPGNVELGTMLK